MTTNTHSSEPTKRLLGNLRIFQAIHNDLKLDHEIVTTEDGTKVWAYTYKGVDPYELEDKFFPTIVDAFARERQKAVEEYKSKNTLKLPPMKDVDPEIRKLVNDNIDDLFWKDDTATNSNKGEAE